MLTTGRRPCCTTCISLLVHLGTLDMSMVPEDGAYASTTVALRTVHQIKHVLTHIHQLLMGSPCPCWHSTKLSLLHSNLPSNWQIPHRNRMVQRTSRIHHPDWGSPCRGLCSTTPSWPQTSLPANSRNHRHNCKGLPGPAAVSAGHRCGASCSTNPS